VSENIYERKKTINIINPTTGLPMSGGGIDINDMPYCNSSNSHDDTTTKSSGSCCLDIYWT